MKVLHIMYQSFPNVSGSSTRSRAIVNSQKNLGLDPIVITSPFQKGENVNNGLETIDDISYHRAYSSRKSYELGTKKGIFTRIFKFFKIVPFTFLIYRVAKREQVDVIHSHAMFFCAIPGVIVSWLLKVPHVYEIRSDWAQNSNFRASGLTKVLMGKLEDIVVKLSKNIVVISKGLKSKYGKLAKHTLLVGNAVPDEVFDKVVSTPTFKGNEKLKIGYFGSVIELEGLDYVLRALSKLPEEKFSLTVAGDGPYLQKLHELASKLKLKNVDLLGRLKPDEVSKLYSEVDVVVNYRVDELVAHTVTPLKPLEAMAYKKLVVASNVGGMTELIENMKTGVVVPSNNEDSLIEALKIIQNDFVSFQKIAEQGYEYVKESKLWSNNAKKYKSLYEELCQGICANGRTKLDNTDSTR